MRSPPRSRPIAPPGASPAPSWRPAAAPRRTAFDPIAEIAQIARVEELWLHVDAAMAGSAMIAPECRALWDGIEGADSLVVNPHKWLGVSMDCSTYFVRDVQLLVRVMSTNPSFLQTAVDGQVKNYRDWGIPLGRRMRALKLWFVIRDQGVSGLQARIRRDLAQAQWLAGEIGRAPHWKILGAGALADAGGTPRAAGPRCRGHRCAYARVGAGGQRFG